MKRLCYLGTLKEGLSAYSSPGMLISRKVMKDKGVVTDFRHLNMRIAKNNLAYPLIKDTFFMSGSSRCEVLSVLNLKDAFHFLETLRKFEKMLWNITIHWQLFIFKSKNAYGIKYFTMNLPMIYKCNHRMFTKQKMLQSNNG